MRSFNFWLCVAIITTVSGLASAQVPGTSASAAPPASGLDSCAAACSNQFNQCLSGTAPDLKAVCGHLPECASVTTTDFGHYNSWFQACLDSQTKNCPPVSCVPPQVTPAPPGGTGTGTTAKPPVRRQPPRALNYQQRCERERGFYVRTESEDDTGARVTKEECLKIGDAFARIAALEEAVKNIQSPQALTQIREEIKQIRESVNATDQPLQQRLAQFDERIKQLSERVSANERNISGLGARVTEIDGRVQRLELQPPSVGASVPGGSVATSRIPFWFSGYGLMHTKQMWDHTMFGVGAEVAIEPVTSEDGSRSFFLALGGGYGDELMDYKLYELHVGVGLHWRFEKWELLTGLMAKRLNTSAWESGSQTHYGWFPEARLPLTDDSVWRPFVSARGTLGFTHYAHPTIVGRQGTEFDATIWAMFGVELDPVHPASRKPQPSVNTQLPPLEGEIDYGVQGP